MYKSIRAVLSVVGVVALATLSFYAVTSAEESTTQEVLIEQLNVIISDAFGDYTPELVTNAIESAELAALGEEALNNLLEESTNQIIAQALADPSIQGITGGLTEDQLLAIQTLTNETLLNNAEVQGQLSTIFTESFAMNYDFIVADMVENYDVTALSQSVLPTVMSDAEALVLNDPTVQALLDQANLIDPADQTAVIALQEQISTAVSSILSQDEVKGLLSEQIVNSLTTDPMLQTLLNFQTADALGDSFTAFIPDDLQWLMGNQLEGGILGSVLGGSLDGALDTVLGDAVAAQVSGALDAGALGGSVTDVLGGSFDDLLTDAFGGIDTADLASVLDNTMDMAALQTELAQSLDLLFADALAAEMADALTAEVVASVAGGIGLGDLAACYYDPRVFGGQISNVVNCSCTKGKVITVGCPRTGVFYVGSKSKVYEFNTVANGRWVLGNHDGFPGPQCQRKSGKSCRTVPYMGEVEIMGTSRSAGPPNDTP